MNPDPETNHDGEPQPGHTTSVLDTWQELLGNHYGTGADSSAAESDPGERHSLRADLAKELFDEAIDDFAPRQRQLGDYLILREIGRGGMGIVYEAEQLSFSRRVALKVLPSGDWVDPDKVSRFHTEARVAASLHHSNIVPVFSQGYDAGVHYFAMQYIEGQPLDQLIRRCRGEESESVDPVSPSDNADDPIETTDDSQQRQASGTFFPIIASMGRQAAEALQHAHDQGVLHRDVKPSNLLLDKDGNIWLTDFGLAKDDLGMDLTESGAHIGTRRYMAPECYDRPADERSDIFGLGVTLYELVAWQNALQDSLMPWSQQVTPLSQLVPHVPRDLETIIHKAIDPDSHRRYETAGELADDLQRYVAGEPIHARRLGWLERSGRWCRRNPALASLTGLVALLLVVLAGGSAAAAVHFSGQADHARGLVAQRERAIAAREAALGSEREAYKASEESRREAEQNADRAGAVTRFLVTDMISDLQPGRRLGKRLTVRSVLDRAARRVKRAFLAQPETEAAVRRALGEAYEALGLHREAEEQLAAAVTLQTATLGEGHRETLMTLSTLANSVEGRGRLRGALKLHQQAYEGLRKICPEDSPYTLAARHNLALCLNSLGRHRESLEIFEEIRDIRVRDLGPDHLVTLKTYNNLALCLKALGRNDEARELHERTLKVRRRVLGNDHPATLMTRHNLAQLVTLGGNHEAARKLYEETLTVKRKTLGPEHPLTLNTMHNLASCLFRQGEYAKSLELNQQTLEIRRRVLDADHPSLLKSQCNLARGLMKLKRHAEARPLLESTLKSQRTARGADHVETLFTQHKLANCLDMLGQTADAGQLLELTVRLRRKRLGPDHPTTLYTLRNLVSNLLRQNKLEHAAPFIKDGVPRHRKRFGADSHRLAQCLVLQARQQIGSDQVSAAVESVREALRIEARKPTTCCRMKQTATALLARGLARLNEARVVSAETR